MKKTYSLLLSGLGLAFGVQPVLAADLLSVYRDAQAYDAQFAAARADRDAGVEKLTQGRSGLLPNLGVGANTTWNDGKTTLRTTPETSMDQKYNTHGWTATLTQPLFRWQNWASYRQGELAAEMAETQLAGAQQELIVRVAQAYFDVLFAQESVATAATQKQAVAQQMESAKRNFEVGTATITDTHEARASYDLAVAAELAAQNDLTVKRQALQVLIGKETDALKTLPPGAQIGRPQPDDIGQWAASAESDNLGVVQARAALDIADQELSKQRGGHLPTIDIVASYGKNAAGYGASTGAGYDATAKTVGLQLSMPLFAGGALFSKDREAAALREKALADLDNARRQAALAAKQSYLGVTSGLSQVTAYEAALASSQSALESNKVGYDVGIRINIDVLNAQTQVSDTRQKLNKARFDTLIAQLRLKQAAGNLTEQDLAAINDLLQ